VARDHSTIRAIKTAGRNKRAVTAPVKRSTMKACVNGRKKKLARARTIKRPEKNCLTAPAALAADTSIKAMMPGAATATTVESTATSFGLEFAYGSFDIKDTDIVEAASTMREAK
jgi:hypothetical protein